MRNLFMKDNVVETHTIESVFVHLRVLHAQPF